MNYQSIGMTSEKTNSQIKTRMTKILKKLILWEDCMLERK